MTNPNGASTPNYNRINEWPLQFLRTGLYHRSYGYLDGRTTGGFWWSGTAGSATHGRTLYAWAGNVYAQNNHFRGFGIALRGVVLSESKTRKCPNLRLSLIHI